MDPPSNEPELLMPAVFEPDDVKTWVKALEEDHARPMEDRQVAGTIMRRMLQDEISTPDRRVLIEDGLHEALEKIFSDGHFCGFTEEQVKCKDQKYHEKMTLVSYSRSRGTTY